MKKGDQTRKKLQLAIRRVETGRVRKIPKGRPLSIMSVAEEAGINSTTIHTRYPETADQIRTLMNKEARDQRDEVRQKLKQERSKNRQLRSEIADLEHALQVYAEENARLALENQQLKAVSLSRKVSKLNPKKR
jgi:hypothetical protein